MIVCLELVFVWCLVWSFVVYVFVVIILMYVYESVDGYLIFVVCILLVGICFWLDDILFLFYFFLYLGGSGLDLVGLGLRLEFEWEDYVFVGS